MSLNTKEVLEFLPHPSIGNLIIRAKELFTVHYCGIADGVIDSSIRPNGSSDTSRISWACILQLTFGNWLHQLAPITPACTWIVSEVLSDQHTCVLATLNPNIRFNVGTFHQGHGVGSSDTSCYRISAFRLNLTLKGDIFNSRLAFYIVNQTGYMVSSFQVSLDIDVFDYSFILQAGSNCRNSIARLRIWINHIDPLKVNILDRSASNRIK